MVYFRHWFISDTGIFLTDGALMMKHNRCCMYGTWHNVDDARQTVDDVITGEWQQ